ncbi:aspartate 1-decarboxylase [Geitlerinema sp. P-1104]|uniref:aspartate 1-decarboxylase n=1 Tax=Geitlerinema sp. P-1104 TaxID=2546230 RepID=UPI001477315D|nr:aspartate 1-decarboxylase [Geitlerinema sp. P-1104]NMG59454.1 aspartate 1-decarboxylase [Geitlerinema sp. P-1104]
MQRSLLYAKLHNCTLTGSNLDYMGSISIDRALLDEVGIVPYEQVQIVNVNNGERLMSYVICAPPQSGLIELNGAAARLGMKGDRLIIMAYAQFSPEDLKHHQPKVVILGQENRIEAVHHYPHPLAPVEQETAEAQLV